MKKLILLTAVFYFTLQIGNAQPGVPDPSFGKNGFVKTDIGSHYNYHNTGNQVLLSPGGSMYFIIETNGITTIAKKFPDGSPDMAYGNKGLSVSLSMEGPQAAFQADGKIVVAGSARSPQIDVDVSEFEVARLNIDGSLDKTFGKNGIRINIGGDYATCVAIQTDGKIVVGGYTVDYFSFDESILLVRYNTDGSEDVEYDNFNYMAGRINSIILQTDGKILAAGDKLFRFNGDLNLDHSFSGDGIVDIGSNAVAIQSDGKIVVAGSMLARYNTDGSPDNTFDSDGIQSVDFGISSLCLQSDGKIVIAGSINPGGNINFAISRYNPDGSPDNTFDVDGKQNTDFGSTNDYGMSVAVQSDGKLVELGYTADGSNIYISAARYNTNGNLDNSFDSDGKFIDKISQGNTSYSASAVQSDGKIIAAGNTWNGTTRDFALVRYKTDGSPDSTFDDDGKQITDFGSANDYANTVAIQNDGKILVAGKSGDNFALARYNADGKPDNTFSGDGKQITDFGSADYINKIVIQGDGKIVAGGSRLARYNTDGTLDTGFNSNSLVCSDVAIQTDGKIVITDANGEHSSRSTVARYNIDGLPDNTFGDNGTVVLFDDDYIFYGQSVAIQTDGKILIGGSYYYNQKASYQIFKMVRMNTDGSMDDTFGVAGTTLAGFNSLDYGTSVKIQNDNKIILAGFSYNGSSYDFTVLRFNTNGSLDDTFNGTGIQAMPASSADDGIGGISISANKLYAVGYGQFPGNLGVVASYLLNDETPVPPTISLITPANNASYLSGANVYLNALASDADGTISKVKFFNGSRLLFIATDTPYTFKWEHVHPGNYVLVAKATDNSGLVTVSDSVHISVVPNKPPTVNIINPANGQTFLKGATVHLQAAAEDADGRIGKVEFYNGTTLLATEHKLPYKFDWIIGKAGNYTLTARATDNWGAVTISAAIIITVVPNQPPTVNLVSPSNGQIFTAPATIKFEAAAQDADGRIGQVGFYNSTTLLTNEHKLPYTYQWQNVPAGTYTITTVAKDNWGAETISAPITITVKAPGELLLSNRRSSTGIKSGIKEEAGLQLAPNPAHNILNISTTGLQKNKRSAISVISASGVVIKTLQLSGSAQRMQLNVSSLTSGTYIVKIISGDKVMYKRFVKR